MWPRGKSTENISTVINYFYLNDKIYDVFYSIWSEKPNLDRTFPPLCLTDIKQDKNKSRKVGIVKSRTINIDVELNIKYLRIKIYMSLHLHEYI